MKTRRSARKIRKLQIAALCLAVVAFAGIGSTIGESLPARSGQATLRQTEVPPAPNFDLGVLMAANP